jgi:DNA sulfur modification protein DndB
MNSYRFPAIRGVQAGRAYYVVMVPFRSVGRLFCFNEEDLPPDLRAQRDLNKGRVPAIAQYISDNSREYILSALAASVDGSLRFEPSSSDPAYRSVGTLVIEMTATILINDGQHRCAGIVEALRDRPHLGDETIAVTIFPDEGLERSQQMFVDLNQHSVKPARSLRLFYDSRDQGARLTRAVVRAIPLLRDLTDFTRSNLPAGSRKLFAFSNLHAAVATLVTEAGLDATPEQAEVVIEFWNVVIANMPDWLAVARREVSPVDLRRDMIHAHGVALEAIGIAGARAINDDPVGWPETLIGLRDIDWSRANRALWEGRALVGGKINRSRTSVMLTAELISRSLAQVGTDGARQIG